MSPEWSVSTETGSAHVRVRDAPLAEHRRRSEDAHVAVHERGPSLLNGVGLVCVGLAIAEDCLPVDAAVVQRGAQRVYVHSGRRFAGAET